MVCIDLLIMVQIGVQPESLSTPYIYALAVSGTNIFAGADGDGVFRSTNNGTTWTLVSTGITNTRIFALATSGTNLYAGTFGGGVFLSTNNGTNWTPDQCRID